MTETQGGIDAAIQKQGIKKGIILGVVVLTLKIFDYYFLTVIARNPIVVFVGGQLFETLLPIACTAVLSYLIRQSIGGYWSFRQAVRGVFVMMLISFAILTVGRDWIFGKLIEPKMIDKTEVAIEASERASYIHQKLSPSQVNAKIAEKQKYFAMAKKVSVYDTIEGYVITIIFLFVGSLLFGLLFKRELMQTAEVV